MFKSQGSLVSGIGNSKKVKKFYDQWSKNYDNTLKQWNYNAPEQVAKILYKKFNPSILLDLACGTGLSGSAFKFEGFNYIDGTDISTKMIEIARSKKIYKNIYLDDANNSKNLLKNYYFYIAAVGVISPTHASFKTIKVFFSFLKLNGLMVFSLNDHALEDERYENEIDKLVKNNDSQILDVKYGEHLPKINLKSKVYVLKKIK